MGIFGGYSIFSEFFKISLSKYIIISLGEFLFHKKKENMDINTVIEFLKTVAPYLTIWVGIFLISTYSKLMKFWWSTEERLKHTDKLDSVIGTINQNMSEIKGTLNVITSRLDKVEWSYTQHFSPIDLTKKWKEIIESERVQESIINRWDEIKSLLKKECVKMNPYDIQEFLFSTALTKLNLLLDDEWFTRLKTRAYKEGVPIEVFSRIVAVVIRNKYLNEKWINVDEIDKHDPAQPEKVKKKSNNKKD